jgi:hypothetical protein
VPFGPPANATMKNYFKILLFGATLGCVSVQAQVLVNDFRSFPVGGRFTSGVYDPTDPYRIGAQDWVANLLPLQATYARAVSENFGNVLSAAFPTAAGWTYASAPDELSAGSLVLHTYDVLGRPGAVGAMFHLEYAPHGDDPRANLHWIQVITNNHDLPGMHGIPANEVDAPNLFRSPYYDDGGLAGPRFFFDFPRRFDANQSHIWQAELFLVTGPPIGTTGLVTFHGGVRWGWENHPVPEPATVWFVVGLAALFLCRTALRRRARPRAT